MIRYTFLILALTVTAATAQPLQFGPAARVAPFTFGTPGGDYLGSVAPRGNGFVAYWLHDSELWSESVSGSPPRPDVATAHPLGVYPDFMAETVNGPMILYRDGASSAVRLLDVPGSIGTVVSPGTPSGIECNSTRCLVSIDNDNTFAVVDTIAQVVKVFPSPIHVRFHTNWATDPNGFLVLLTADDGSHAISIDNNGSIRADVKIDPLNLAAVAFNGDRYAIFKGSASGITAFTMTVDGQTTSPRIISSSTLQPIVAAWNGSEDLLVGFANPVVYVPEVIPPNALSGLRIAPDLTPIDPHPFQIQPSDAANYPTSIAWNGSTFYVVWTHTIAFPSTNLPIYTTVEGATISPAGDVVAHDLVSWGTVPQTSPRIARGGQTVVVWSEFDIQSGIATLRYSMGAGHPFNVSTGTPIDVVSLAEDYLVVWNDSGRTRAAILTSDLTWSEVTLPTLNYTTVAVAANRDHWLIAGSIGADLVTVAVAHDGIVSRPTIVAALPYVTGLASDGDHFFLTADQRASILDSAGSPIIALQPHGRALLADFAGGVYATLTGLGTLDRYDRQGNFIGSTKFADSGTVTSLSHVGSRFVLVDSRGGTALAHVIASDGTLIAQNLQIPDAIIAKSDSPTSAAVVSGYAFDAFNRSNAALFLAPVSIADTKPHRAVKH